MTGSASVAVVADVGHIWSANDARELRQEHRIIGSAIGCVGGLHKQAAVNGLPVVLSPEEVSLGLQAGWVTQQGAVQEPGSSEPEQIVEQASVHDAPTLPNQPTSSHRHRQQQHPHQHQEADVAASGHPTGPQTDPGPGPGSRLVLHGPAPDSHEAATATRLTAAGAGSLPAPPAPRWTYPRCEDEQRRLSIFRDLHKRGYALTGGAKFGADYLAYPGDPALYHAQFTVRSLPWDQPLRPLQLQSWGRGAHAARKHLLLASVDPAQQGMEAASGAAPVVFVTVAPEDGFGNSS